MPVLSHAGAAIPIPCFIATLSEVALHVGAKNGPTQPGLPVTHQLRKMNARCLLVVACSAGVVFKHTVASSQVCHTLFHLIHEGERETQRTMNREPRGVTRVAPHFGRSGGGFAACSPSTTREKHVRVVCVWERGCQNQTIHIFSKGVEQAVPCVDVGRTKACGCSDGHRTPSCPAQLCGFANRLFCGFANEQVCATDEKSINACSKQSKVTSPLVSIRRGNLSGMPSVDNVH